MGKYLRNITFTATAIVAAGIAVPALAEIRSPAMASPLAPRQIGMFHFQGMPSWEYFENIVRRDAQWWFGNRYVVGTLSRVDIVDGSISSGHWSARGNFYYISGWDDRQYTGWVIFRFRNGYFDCLVYHDFPRTCRAANGF